MPDLRLWQKLGSLVSPLTLSSLHPETLKRVVLAVTLSVRLSSRRRPVEA